MILEKINPKRLLLKISGELMSSSANTIDAEACKKLAASLALLNKNFELALVIGGGNICRGAPFSSLGFERPAADNMGMLATMINGIALKQALEAIHCEAVVMSAIECPKVAELYNWSSAKKKLADKKVLIFVAGTGNPFFTTDTAAALRACEINADLLLKATKVDGIYDKDPLLDNSATFYPFLSYSEILAGKLKVMDATAIALCMSNQLPIRVFNMKHLFETNFLELLKSGSIGTFVSENPRKT